MKTRFRKRKKKDSEKKSEGNAINSIFKELVETRIVEAFTFSLREFLKESIKIIKKRRRPDQIDFHHFSMCLSDLCSGIEHIFKFVLLRKQTILIDCNQEAQYQLQDLFKFEMEVNEVLVKELSSFFLDIVLPSNEKRLNDLILDWLFENLRKKRYSGNSSIGHRRKRRKMNFVGWHKQDNANKEESMIYLKIVLAICKPLGSQYQVYLNSLEKTEKEEEKTEESLRFLPHSNIYDTESFVYILKKIDQFQFGWVLRQISTFYPNLFAVYCLSSLMNKIGSARTDDSTVTTSPIGPTGSTMFDQTYFRNLGVTSEVIILTCLIQESPKEIIAQIGSVLKSYSDLCESGTESEYQSILLFMFCFTIMFRCEGVISLFHDFVENILENRNNLPPMLLTLKKHIFPLVDVNSLLKEVIKLRLNEFSKSPIHFLEKLELSYKFSVVEHVQSELMRMKVNNELQITEDNRVREVASSNKCNVYEFLERIAMNEAQLTGLMKKFFHTKRQKEKSFWFYLIECLGLSKGQYFGVQLLTCWVDHQYHDLKGKNDTMVDEEEEEEEEGEEEEEEEEDVMMKSNVSYFNDIFRSFCDCYLQFKERFFENLLTEISEGIKQLKAEHMRRENEPSNNSQPTKLKCLRRIMGILEHLNLWSEFLQQQQRQQREEEDESFETKVLKSLVKFCVENWSHFFGIKFLYPTLKEQQILPSSPNTPIFYKINRLFLNLIGFKQQGCASPGPGLPPLMRSKLESLCVFLVLNFHFLLTPFPKINELEFPTWSRELVHEKSLMMKQSHTDEYKYFTLFRGCIWTSLEQERTESIALLRGAVDILETSSMEISENTSNHTKKKKKQRGGVLVWDCWFQLIFSRIMCSRLHPNGVVGIDGEISNNILPFHLHHNFLGLFHSLFPDCFYVSKTEKNPKPCSDDETPKDGILKGPNHELYLESLFSSSSERVNPAKKYIGPRKKQNVVLNVSSRTILRDEELEANDVIRASNEEWILTFLRGMTAGEDNEGAKFRVFSRSFLKYLDYVQKNEVPPRLEDYNDVFLRKTIQYNFDILVCSFFTKYTVLHETLYLVAQKHRKEFTRYFHLVVSLFFDVITKWELLQFFEDTESNSSIEVDRSCLLERKDVKREELFIHTEKTVKIVLEAQWVPMDHDLKSFLLIVIRKFSNKEVLDVLRKFFVMLFLFRPSQGQFKVTDTGTYERKYSVKIMENSEVMNFNMLVRRCIQKHIMEFDSNITPFLF